jgi:hypothetical protein
MSYIRNVHDWTDAWNIINLRLEKLYFLEDNLVQYSFRKSWLLLSIFEQWMLGVFNWLIGIKKDFVFHFKILVSFFKEAKYFDGHIDWWSFLKKFELKFSACKENWIILGLKKTFIFNFDLYAKILCWH